MLDSLPNWLSAFGTVGTLIFSLIQLSMMENRARSAERRELAEKVVAWFGHMGVGADREIVIKNSSGFPIYDVVISVVLISGAGPRKGEEIAELERRAGLRGPTVRVASTLIPPGLFRTTLEAGYGGMNRKPGCEIAFTDAKGNHWIRRATGKLISIPESAIQALRYPQPFGEMQLRCFEGSIPK